MLYSILSLYSLFLFNLVHFFKWRNFGSPSQMKPNLILYRCYIDILLNIFNIGLDLVSKLESKLLKVENNTISLKF